MKKQLLTGVLLLTLTWSFGQTKNLGDPLSWNGKMSEDIETVKAPSFDVAAQLEIDAINKATAKHLANRFGYEHEVNYGLNNSGTWFTTPKGDDVWRLGINSPGAFSINLVFDDYKLPQGAKLYFYSKDRSQVIGAYTAENNNVQNMLGTELINSDEAVLELFIPKGKKEETRLHILNIVHGYVKLRSLAQDLTKALNSSGDCNLDVNCLAGDGTAWENQRNSVGMIVSGGGICTGSLVNNTANDGTPYFITANHCNPGSAGSWVFRFRWESATPDCATTANSQNGPENMNINGGSLVASNSNADFGLILMNATPDPAWNIYYNGWDMSDNTAGITSAFGIHHPSGDIKKICVEDDTPTQIAMNFNGDNNTRMWRIEDWDQGVTEPGSSGSPLFRPDGKLIGVLSGGYAACSGTVDNDTEDWYGRFGIAWDELSNNNQQLKHWLDPSNSGVTEIDGFDPNGGGSPLALDAGITSITSPTGTVCAASISPEVTLRNYGTTTLTSITINYSVDGGANQAFNWTGSLAQGTSESVTLATMATSNGAHNITVDCVNPNGGTDENINNDDANSAFNAVVGGGAVNLALQLDCYGSETTWEVRDASNNVLYSGGPYSDVFNNADLVEEEFCLASDQCYDFILMDSYGDGLEGGFSCGPGTYTISNASGQLASMIAVDGAFDDEETNNFCTTVGLIEESLAYSLHMYPNPAKDQLTIETSLEDTYQVKLIDQSGRTVQLINGSGYSKNQINVSSLSSGVYLVKLIAQDGVVTKKVMID